MWTAVRRKYIPNQVVFSTVHAMVIPMLMLRFMICHRLTIAPSVDTCLSSRIHSGSTSPNDYGHKLHWYYSEISTYLKYPWKSYLMRTLFHESIICLLPFHSPQYPSLPSLFIMLNLTMNLIIWENYNLQVEPEDTKYIQICHIWLLKYISTWRNQKIQEK